jgi:hypothetical protein
MVSRLKRRGFDIEFRGHAEAILSTDFPAALQELESVLRETSIPILEIIGSGGGEAAGTQRMRRALDEKGWKKSKFEIIKIVNNERRESATHEIDHVRALEGGTLALEIEWNNKDPFFDRDLDNFKRLHADSAVSAGIIITRGSSLQASLKPMVLRFAKENRINSFDDLANLGIRPPTPRQKAAIEKRADRDANFPEAWSSHFVADKFGEATTHWRKLQERVQRGVGSPCPLLMIGLSDQVVSF